jgi:hypothetical protein
MTSTAGVVTTAGGPDTGGTISAGGSVVTGGVSFDTSAGPRDGGIDAPETGGKPIDGGSSTTGGTFQVGGTISSGGATDSGGATSSGGHSDLGGTISSGGTATPGGATDSGGTTSSGGTANSGGTSSSGGTTSSGGTIGPVTTSCPGAAPAGFTSSFCKCDQYASWPNAGFTYNNNVWGGVTGFQCIWASTAGQWGVAANQPANPSNIKSYANVSLMPNKAIKAINSFNSSFDVNVPSSGSWETAYDIFVKNNAIVATSPRTEIMLWMNQNGPVQPYASAGSPSSPVADQTNVTVGGHTWNVYSGMTGGHDIVTFVRTSNTESGSVDIKAILLWLIANPPPQYGVFTANWSLDQVQFGFQITSNANSTQAFVTNSYSVTSS